MMMVFVLPSLPKKNTSGLFSLLSFFPPLFLCVSIQPLAASEEKKEKVKERREEAIHGNCDERIENGYFAFAVDKKVACTER